ncbi:hypothetical protein [Vogesella indigofera]|uniref:hypothetical protein n=1 Tax=Vogesella indigofera TaxID=45465 RepID=UPI00234E9893|nr:hypothetical protein [Vogesella indigofera]MDC7697912.1 hypothetical protein [Vogesella indigofera]
MSRLDNLLLTPFMETLKRAIEIQAVACTVAVGVGWLSRNKQQAQSIAQVFSPGVQTSYLLMLLWICTTCICLHASVYLARNIMAHYFFACDWSVRNGRKLKRLLKKKFIFVEGFVTAIAMSLPAIALVASFLHGTS